MNSFFRVCLILFCFLLNLKVYSQTYKLIGIDVTNKRVLIDSLYSSKFNKIDTLRFKFDAFSNYTKTFDTKNNRYILECDTALILFNSNGTIYKTIHKTYDLEGLEYNPIDGMVYCIAFKVNTFYFAKINLNNGQLSLLKSISDNSANSSTLDYEKGYYYIISDSKGLFKIDIKTGSKVDSTKLFTTNNCSCTEYDNETEKLATICVVNSKKVMQLYSPNNKTFQTIDTIEKYGTGYFGYNASAYNQATGHWYINLGKNIGVKNTRTNSKMDTLTSGFNRIRSIEYPGQACYNPLKTISVLATDPVCHAGADGSIQLTVSGGRPPYFYSINNQTFDTLKHFKHLSSGYYNIQARDKNTLCQIAINSQLNEVSAFNHTSSIKHNTCYGDQKGELTISTTGSNAPYTYALNNNTYASNNHFNNLSAASYSIFIKDKNNCKDTLHNLTINAPTELQLDSITQIPISCHNSSNGALFALPKGGVAPYTLTLNSINVQSAVLLENISAGTYNFKISDANACLLEQQLEWVNPEPIELNAFVKNKVCKEDAATQVVIKSKKYSSLLHYTLKNTNNGIAYLLNDTIKNLNFGLHTFDIETEKGCKDSISIELKSPKGLIISKTKDTVLCEGQISAIQLNTVGAITYETKSDNGLQFNTASFSTEKAGTYITTFTDSNACHYNDTFNIYKVNQQVLHDFLVPSMALLSDTVYAVIISQPTADFNKWTCSNANAKIKTSNTNNTQWQFQDTGKYTLFLSSTYGACHFETSKNIHILSNNDSIKLERTLGYKGSMIKEFKVYSNPHDGQHFSIEINLRDTAKAMLYKIDGNGGQILSELDLGAIKTKTFMAFASLKSEVYYLKLVVGRESRVIKVVAVL